VAFDVNKLKAQPGQPTHRDVARELKELTEQMRKLNESFQAFRDERNAHKYGSPHRDVLDCKCLSCAMNRFSSAREDAMETARVKLSLHQMEHELADDCPCVECDEWRAIREKYLP
jgi:hypothetical protein